MSNLEKISKRKAFYVSGFDPRGARQYFHMFKEESKKQAELSGYEITTSKRSKKIDHLSNWNVKLKEGDSTVLTEYNFACWDDLIREIWIKNIFLLTLASLALYICYLFTGVFFRVKNMGKNSFIIIFMPITVLLFFIYTSYLIANYSYELSNSLTLASLVFLGAYYLIAKLEKILSVFWILRTHLFCGYFGLRKDDKFEKRIGEISNSIKASIQKEKVDEILFVTHSAGVIYGASIIYRFLKDNPNILKKVKILNVGQCYPMTTFMPWAGKFNSELAFLAAQENLYILDIASPVDGACNSISDPFHRVTEEVKCTVKKMSPKFHLMFDKKKYRWIKRNKFRIHFQYLMAPHKKVDYDYFKLVCGQYDFLENFKE